MSRFNERYRNRRNQLRSHLCVGLDPNPELLPPEFRKPDAIVEFHKEVIQGTADLAVAYKPNLAFFESMGVPGWDLFEKTIELIRSCAPGALIIADAKRGDIGNTAKLYAKAFFETFDCDALTVNPFMGPDTVQPYLEYNNKGIIVLCLTSNPGSEIFLAEGARPLYKKVAEEMQTLNQSTDNIWLVVGATNHPDRIKEIRSIAPDLPFLVPGVGAQGGSAVDVFQNAGDDILINASRSILYTDQSGMSVAEKARHAAQSLVEEFRNQFE